MLFYTYSRARLRVSRFLVGTTIQLSNAEKKETSLALNSLILALKDSGAVEITWGHFSDKI